MSLVRTLSPLIALAGFATVGGCSGCKKDPNPDPPPPPSATVEVVPPPTTAPTPTPLQTAALPPGVAPSTLAEAIQVTQPQMADSTGAPDPGSTNLLTYWQQKLYPWAQLQAVSEVQPTAFLTAPDRGKRVCGTGTVQAFSSTGPKQYEATLLTKTGETLSIGAVGDATGIKQGGPATFCGIASGVETIGTTKTIRDVGYFDTPANRGATGGGSFGSLKACCQALQQNAASMPPPQNMYALAAAQYCNASVASLNSPGQKDAMIGALRGMLKGAALPGACH